MNVIIEFSPNQKNRLLVSSKVLRMVVAVLSTAG
jgi:hypothetical protein